MELTIDAVHAGIEAAAAEVIAAEQESVAQDVEQWKADTDARPGAHARALKAKQRSIAASVAYQVAVQHTCLLQAQAMAAYATAYMVAHGLELADTPPWGGLPDARPD